MPWILHASDPHLGNTGAVSLDDTKEDFPQPDLETTQRVFKRTLMGLRSYVDCGGRPDIAVFSGDLTYHTHQSGFDAFAQLLEDAADVLPAKRSNIVVVPGNHDVLWSAQPGTPERYAAFLSCTRDVGCTTPLIDGVDFDPSTGELWPAHRDSPHIVPGEILVVPINSSNWCGAIVRPRNAMTLDDWRGALEPTGVECKRLLSEVERLQRKDMARVSRYQVEALGQYLDEIGVPRERRDDPRVRVAVLHHQLLPVSVREERKAFESLINLGLVRATLAEYGFDLVLHGHKHESGMYWDLAGGPSDDLNSPRPRTLVISSPGHFGINDPVMRAIEIDGPKAAPSTRVVTFSGAGPHRRHTVHDDGQRVPLWTADVDRREQTMITAKSAHECYARLRSVFALRNGHELRNVVCQVDDPADGEQLPPDYPVVGVDDPDAWLSALVGWWQLDHSELVARGLIGFNHGERIYRRWGDQVDRAIRILNDRRESSRALVQLVAPRETGRYKMDERDLQRGSFPAFVAAEFSVAERSGVRHLDCFGYFRKQEMQFWWPVNLAELVRLQERVRSKLRPRARTGRIVTFSAVALWKEALPRVAVPLVDLWVEDRSRLLAMAVAAAFPDRASHAAVRDWREVLRDLAGTARDGPPKVSAGVRVLLDDVTALAAIATRRDLGAICEKLEDLDSAYAAHAEAEELPAAARTDVGRRVRQLTETLVAVLPDAAP